MNLLRRSVLLSFVALFGTASLAADPGGKTIRLLNVGNSFSNNAVKYLNDLVTADGANKLILGKAVIGGSSPDKHLDKALANEKDPKNKNGLYSGGKSLKGYLTEEPWDFITVQQASIKSHDI